MQIVNTVYLEVF